MADVFQGEFRIEAVVAGGNGGVGGEDGGSGYAANGVGEWDAAAGQAGHAFEGGEGGMTFVHVNDGGGLSDGIQRDDPTDAEENFLLDAVLAIAAVEVMGEAAVGGGVGGYVGVEEEEVYAADGLTPRFWRRFVVWPSGRR